MKKDKEEIKKEDGEVSPALQPPAASSAPPSAGDTPATPPDKPPESEKQEGGDGKTITVTLRHKTEYPHYRRAGLVLKQTPQTFSVTEAQLVLLMPDKWVEIIEVGKTK
jgi:hypothetical protein